MDDDEVDEVLAHLRHRDAVRVLIASCVLGVLLLAVSLIRPDLPGWAASLQGLFVFGAVAATLQLRRERRARAMPVVEDGE